MRDVLYTLAKWVHLDCTVQLVPKLGRGIWDIDLLAAPAVGEVCDHTVQLWTHDHPPLRGCLFAGADKHRRSRPEVYRHVGNVCWNEQVIAWLRLLAVLEPVAGPQLYLIAAEEVERAFVPLVNMRLRP